MDYSVYVGDEKIDAYINQERGKDLVKKCIKEGQTKQK